MPAEASEAKVVSRLVRLCADQDAALRDLSALTDKPVSRLIREAIEVYTGISDTVVTRRRQGPR